MLFTGCGALYLQLLAVKPKNKINSKNPIVTDFVKKFKHYIQKKLKAGGLKLVFTDNMNILVTGTYRLKAVSLHSCPLKKLLT